MLLLASSVGANTDFEIALNHAIVAGSETGARGGSIATFLSYDSTVIRRSFRGSGGVTVEVDYIPRPGEVTLSRNSLDRSLDESGASVLLGEIPFELTTGHGGVITAVVYATVDGTKRRLASMPIFLIPGDDGPEIVGYGEFRRFRDSHLPKRSRVQGDLGQNLETGDLPGEALDLTPGGP